VACVRRCVNGAGAETVGSSSLGWMNECSAISDYRVDAEYEINKPFLEGMMTTNPALVTRTTLVAEEPWKPVLRRTLQAVAGALDRLLPPQPLNRELPPEWFKYPPF
jgi:hypothetical protein